MLNNYIPNIKLPVPYRLAPQRLLKVYLDSEIKYPLNLKEPDVQKTIVRNIHEYDVFFDLGAHIGTYSILASVSNDIDIYAFEPHPDNMQRIRENIMLNKVDDRVTAISTAVSDSNGETELFLGQGDYAHSVMPIYHSDEERRDYVNTITLNSFCDREGIYPDLIKIDVEGAGGLVLDGASEVINKQPDFLLETHSDKEATAFNEVLESNGYTITPFDESRSFATIKT
jgi:FkbM family methyltransferase